MVVFHRLPWIQLSLIHFPHLSRCVLGITCPKYILAVFHGSCVLLLSWLPLLTHDWSVGVLGRDREQRVDSSHSETKDAGS